MINQIYDLIIKEYPDVQKQKDVLPVIKSGWYRVFRTNKNDPNVVSFYLNCTHPSLARASGGKTDDYGNELIGVIYIESN